MSRLDRFEQLARHASDEPVPTPDVSAAVRRRLRATEQSRTALPYAFAGACACAATVAGYVGFQGWQALTDPWLGTVLSVSAWWLL